MCSKLEDIDKYLKKNLSNDRYNHSVRVMKKAMEYAKIYNYDIEIAQIVGLSHDIAKEMSDLENTNYIIKNNLNKKLLDNENKYAVHGFVGADFLEKNFKFTKEMANAVRYHTTGRENMTLLDKIIFLADKTEDGRYFDNIEEERQIALKDLDKAMILTLQNSINYTKKKGKIVSENSIKALKDLKKRCSLSDNIG